MKQPLKADTEVLSCTALERSKARLKASETDKRYSLSQAREFLKIGQDSQSLNVQQ